MSKTNAELIQNAIESGGLQNEFGYFDSKTSAFVITNILTPKPWVNVMSNGDYGLVLSQAGGGFSWVQNSQLRRLTRWEQDLVLDNYGRWVYFMDTDGGEVFSTTYAPTRQKAEQDSVEHGLGYTTFRRRFGDLESEHTVFVPLDGSVEHGLIRITNHGTTPKQVRVGSYVEWFLGSQGEWHREFHRLFISVEATENAVLAWKRQGLDEGTRIPPEVPMVAFVGVDGLNGPTWFADRSQWIGREARIDRPEGLVSDIPSSVTGRWDDPIGAFRAEATIEPGETLEFGLTIGAAGNRSEALVEAGVTVATIKGRLEQAKSHFAKSCGQLGVSTGVPAFDMMNNAWLPHQAYTGRLVARSAYYQQGGAYGYRDQLQDSLSLLETEPDVTFRQLEIHAEAMYEDGGVRHWWHPETRIFAESHHSDTCLWLAFGMLAYLEETADFGLLEKPVRYLKHETQEFGRTGSMLDHCLNGIEHMLARRSSRGLPLIGSGDWNDGLSHAGIEGKGESVWVAMFGFHILLRMADVLEQVGERAKATRLRTEASALQTAVEAYAWDGDWYIAGTSDNGQPFGSKSNVEGQIFLNPQTWAAITGIGDPDRVVRALQSAKEQLVKPYGALLLAPAYKTVDPYVGYITRYSPGLRENGGVYSHASTWAVQAFAQAGDIDTAYAIYKGMMPPLRAAESAERYQAEPYVMPGNVDGPDSPYEGRAGWTWYTGSAAWMRRIALQSLLGVRATLAGLELNGRVPKDLGHVRVTRPFRGDTFDIEIEPGTEHRLIVDGKPHQGQVVAASGESLRRSIRLEATTP
ncbi:MAG TPA: hypothetical protein PKA27_13885 [Fimbriimonadaceae bacterium]|nr:hypothetical protein [Fimbriimonadaceae bacterium]